MLFNTVNVDTPMKNIIKNWKGQKNLFGSGQTKFVCTKKVLTWMTAFSCDVQVHYFKDPITHHFGGVFHIDLKILQWKCSLLMKMALPLFSMKFRAYITLPKPSFIPLWEIRQCNNYVRCTNMKNFLLLR